MANFSDGLTNIAVGLGVSGRDKLAGTSYSAPVEYADTHWSNMHRDSWAAKAVVDIPAEDATREWREWQAEADQISAIEADENRLALADRLTDAYKLARLYGRAYVYFDLGDDPSVPANPNRVKRGGIRFITTLSRREVIDGDIQDDPMQAGYGDPAWYEVASVSAGHVRIHPSRMITLYGDKRPIDFVFGRQSDSVLRKAQPAIIQHDSIMHNVAALVFEAKVDVWTVNGLADILADPEDEQGFLKAAQASNAMKSMHGMLLIEGGNGESPNKYEQKKVSFATLPDIISKAQDQVCAAAKFSKAYLFGQSAGGLGSSGNMELEMDYGKIAKIQRTELQPAMAIFDECLIRSALGSRPKEIHYNWRPLWQMSDADRAKIALDTANAFKIMKETGEVPEGVLTLPMINTMTERGGVNGLEAAYNEWIDGGGNMDDVGDPDDGDLDG